MKVVNRLKINLGGEEVVHIEKQNVLTLVVTKTKIGLIRVNEKESPSSYCEAVISIKLLFRVQVK